MYELDVDDGWSLETDEGWSLDEPPRPAARETEREQAHCRPRSHIVRLPGRVVIYPQSAARERRLASFWKAALAG